MLDTQVNDDYIDNLHVSRRDGWFDNQPLIDCPKYTQIFYGFRFYHKNYTRASLLLAHAHVAFLDLNPLGLPIPSTQVIIVSRDIRDTLTSIYTSNFDAREASLNWAYSLEGIVSMLSVYKQLTQHWLAALPKRGIRMHSVTYEVIGHGA